MSEVGKRETSLSITHKSVLAQSHVDDRCEPNRSSISNRAEEAGVRKESSATAMRSFVSCGGAMQLR